MAIFSAVTQFDVCPVGWYNCRMEFLGRTGALGVVVSPDGKHAYVAGSVDHAVTALQRDPESGELSFLQVLKEGVDGVSGLQGAIYLDISPDGQFVYVAGSQSDALAVFRRDADTGHLTFETSFFDAPDDLGLDGAFDVEVSPEGTHVYVLGRESDSLTAFARDMATGDLTHVQTLRHGVGGINGLDYPFQLTASPDGNHLYVVSDFSNALMVFDRDPQTGLLTPIQTLKQNVGGVLGLGRPRAIAISPDGTSVYSGTFDDQVIGIFDRNYVPASQLVQLAEGEIVEGIDFAAHYRTMPEAVGDAFGVDENHVLIVEAPGVLVNDSDPNGDPLTAILVDDVSHGTLDLQPDGSFTYTPHVGFDGDDTFTYKANDGQEDSNVATVTVTVLPDVTAPLGELDYPQPGTVIEEDQGYVDVRWFDPGAPAAGIDVASIGVDDVTIDSEGTPLSVDESLDLGGGVWRYIYGSDGDALAEGTLTVTLVAGEVADLAGNVNLEATETFTYQPPPLSQIVWGVDAEGNEHQVAAIAGMPFSFTVRYTTNDDNPALTGLGLRMHFDSGALTFDGLSDVLATGLVGEAQVMDDTDDLDGDPDTDSFVLVSWADITGNWPGGTLPVDLFTANFTAGLGVPDGGVTPVNFTDSSTALSMPRRSR